MAARPLRPSGYRTGYFWENVLQRDKFLDILGHFMFVEKKEEKVEDGRGGQRHITKEAVIFPRYHQLDAVRKIVDAARDEGPGRNYLIQHSAGSGKTNSISWLSHRLASLHDSEDRKVFDCVVVITDRRVLDQQLQDAIYQIEHAQGVVKAIDQDSKQLAAALIDGTKIVITTLQKFPFVLRGLLHAAGAGTQEQATAEEKAQAKAWEREIATRRYAVIVDEAHSSQTGETARELKAIFGAGATEDVEGATDWEDGLNQVMASRGPQPNLSFFAFTATPKGKTLELFGRSSANGTPEAFHAIGAGRREARGGAGRTSVSQSLGPTGHSVRCTFAEGVAKVNAIGDFSRKVASPSVLSWNTIHAWLRELALLEGSLDSFV